MKTFDKKDIFSWANCEEAEKYIGKEGYLADTLDVLEGYVKGNIIEILGKIDPNNSECFTVNDLSYGGINYSLFLPADKVDVEIEKKLRPFKSVKEFVETTGLDIGQCIFIRQTKGDYAKQWTTKALITSITDYVGDTPSITFGNDCWSVEELADKYEYSRDTTRWYPFGVEE